MIKTALKIVTLIFVLTGLLCGYIMFFAGNLKYSEEININQLKKIIIKTKNC